MSDFPEELKAEIPDPVFFQMWVVPEEEGGGMDFSYGGMNHYEMVGRMRFLLEAIEAGDTEPVEDE